LGYDLIQREFWAGRRVFLTGHTGFKGAWMSLLLRSLGAEVCGFALPPEHDQGLFAVGRVEKDVRHIIGDVRDLPALARAVKDARPDVVIHMAAQSLVRLSYADPVRTFETNVMGTANLLEAVRHCPEVRAVLVVTSDKCYENLDWAMAYRETDQLGGRDPYSSSKACAEIVTSAYRTSFFAKSGQTAVATVRAGNVFGGGDWATDRLIPDAMRAFGDGKTLSIRNPHAVRPWQHVFDVVLAYLELAQLLVRDGQAYAEAWNIGPSIDHEVPVSVIVNHVTRRWGDKAGWAQDSGLHPHESKFLRLDCSKAYARFGWRSRISLEQGLDLTVAWYRAAHARGADLRAFSLRQLEQFV
jgi:CDP-glucose 4,6-dehydratase